LAVTCLAVSCGAFSILQTLARNRVGEAFIVIGPILASLMLIMPGVAAWLLFDNPEAGFLTVMLLIVLSILVLSIWFG
jgi:hypothetical protein